MTLEPLMRAGLGYDCRGWLANPCLGANTRIVASKTRTGVAANSSTCRGGDLDGIRISNCAARPGTWP